MKLRHVRKEDLGFILRLWADRETMEAVGGPVSMTKAQADDWFADMVHPGTPSNCYRLIVGDDGELVGEVSFHRFDPTTGRAELNIKVLSSARGKGYGRRALRLFTGIFFELETAQELVDDVSLGNIGGQALLEKFGFHRDHAQAAVCRYRLSREAWQSLKESVT